MIRYQENLGWIVDGRGLPVRARHSIRNLERDVQGGGLRAHHLLLLLKFVATTLDRDTQADLRLLLKEG